MTVEAVLLIVAAYLVGSIPTAHLASRWLEGADLRRYGSGTISASMVLEHIARWAVVPVGLFDVAKAALPAWLGLQWGLGHRWQWRRGWQPQPDTTGRFSCGSRGGGA